MKDIDIFIPCCVDQFSTQVGKDLISLVKSMGFNPVYNEQQTCCSKVLYENGNWKEATTVGEKLLEDFKGQNTIVGCSASCIGYIKGHLGNLFHNTSYHNDYKLLANRIMDISEFIHCFKSDCDLGAEFPFKVYLHCQCQSKNYYDVEEECRLILNKVKGLELVNEQCDKSCCGFGGSLYYYNPLVSEELARMKVEKAISLGAEYITSTDASCLMQMNAYINKKQLEIKTIHLVSLLMYNRNNIDG
ncbi:MAG: (Fe-S)-binding protein [Bacteroidales bacterium]|nr:(Fe-S)-binding protein [Bacteroidales bacterium]